MTIIRTWRNRKHQHSKSITVGKALFDVDMWCAASSLFQIKRGTKIQKCRLRVLPRQIQSTILYPFSNPRISLYLPRSIPRGTRFASVIN